MKGTLDTKYRIYDLYNEVIADNMSFEMAMAFVEGYRYRFRNDVLILKIEQIMDWEDD